MSVYLGTEKISVYTGGIAVKNSGQYVWSKQETETGKILEYVIGETEADYPDGGWKDGFWYVLKLAPIPTYLSFIGNEDFTLKTYNTTKNWDGVLEYSTDTSTWNIWDGTEISSVGNKLYLRGTGNTRITGSSNDHRFVFTGTSTLKIDCEGNIENLLDYETVSAGGHPTLADYCYNRMFYGCTNIKLSITKTGEYQTEYRIPKSGTGTTSSNALESMFTNTGGTFTGTPEINTTYYLSTSNTVV